MENKVAVLGAGKPHLAQAVEKQLGAEVITIPEGKEAEEIAEELREKAGPGKGVSAKLGAMMAMAGAMEELNRDWIYSGTTRKQRMAPPCEKVRTEPKIQRNSPCPCGSGKKYKQCCLKKEA